MSKTEDGDGFPKQLSNRGRTASVLSTKKLSPGQRELLLNRGFGLVEMDFITVVPINFQIKNLPPNLIFTSKNSVKSILNHPLKKEIQEKNIFCVGEKTAEFLKQNGFKVSKKANYGANLASEIINNHRIDQFLFFCGKKRNPDLPERLNLAGVNFIEVEVYDTHELSKKIDRTFDGVLFFSPSAVRSYCSENAMQDSIAFCIGTTTAAEARKLTNNIVIATTPSIENVIVQVVKTFT
ncbi:uroporphyrinogen-III synthase [Salinimicrobium terrae]|uniref:uroporphyrinogen-III synthase n=1 Tax=Salinimicrobium terrae TaxID=470866 RepID=UPI000411969E|nr:uroporphyrinogen-III synthase [Salinimicrobium terrae]